MKSFLATTLLMASVLLAGACATKKYVNNTVDPVSGKLDQVAARTDQQGKTLDETRQSLDLTKGTLEKDETALNATNERAVSADNRAGQAIGRADDANQKADKVGHDLGDLRNVVANLDDYKQVSAATVNFKFDSDKLSDDAKRELDQMAGNQNQYKRFFVAVEGFTDSVGSVDYNNALSRRRADAVVEYLVAQHDIPIYRIHMVGLGKQKPVEDARTRAAQAKNRRVEVMLFSADQNVAQNSGASSQPNIPNAQ